MKKDITVWDRHSGKKYNLMEKKTLNWDEERDSYYAESEMFVGGAFYTPKGVEEAFEKGRFIRVDEVVYNKVSPEDLKSSIEKRIENLTEEVQTYINNNIQPLHGTVVPDDKYYKLSRDFIINDLIKYSTKQVIFESLVEDDLVKKEKVKEIFDKTKTFKPKLRKEDGLVVFTDTLEVDAYYGSEGLTLDYYLSGMYKISPNESSIKKQAAIETIQKEISECFVYDCEATEDYIKGNMTWKGFVKTLKGER